MSVVREPAYQALLAVLADALPMPVFRDEVDQRELAEGSPYAILYTASAPELESECIGVPHYEFRDDADVELYLQSADAAARNAAIAEFASGVAAAVHGSTLGGLVTMVRVGPATLDHLGVEGAAGVAYARVPLAIHYQTGSPIG